MYRIKQIIHSLSLELKAGFFSEQLSIPTVFVVMMMVTLLALYQFIIYRFLSKKSFYSKYFNMTLALLPYFISTIVLTLQTNLVITLGTIGALAIIRFRTAIKEPMDMIHLFWSVHTGIVCGARRYELGIIVSFAVSVLMIGLDLLPLKRAPILLIVNIADIKAETEIMHLLKKHANNPRVKARNLHSDGIDMIIELSTKNEQEIFSAISSLDTIRKFSMVSHDGESII